MVLYPCTRLLGNFLYNVQGSTDWIILTLGKGNIFTSVCQSFCPQTGAGEGHLCMMSPPVWLPGPMFLLSSILSRGRALCPLGFLSRGKGSLSSTVSVQGVSVQRSLSKGLCSRMCLCPGGEVIVQGSLCPGESLPRGSLPRRGSLSGTSPKR